MPITDVERILQEQDLLVSKTDLKGIITYANDDFIRISGYTLTELIGTSHNIVRHPDMPEAAFIDLWKCLREGRPWTALVKNRCKNNDFYWVVANITPYYENDKLIGYVSVRSKPSHEQITTADNAYRQFLQSKTGKKRFENGKIINVSFLSKVSSRIKNAKFFLRFLFFLFFVSLLILTIIFNSLHGMNQSNQSLSTIYQDRVLPFSQLSSIKELLQDNYHGITSIMITPTTEAINKYAGELEINSAEINILWAAYSATLLTPQEKVLSDKFIDDREKWQEQALKPTLAALKAHNFELANALLINKVHPLFDPINLTTRQLIQLQLSVARQEFELAQPRYERQRNLLVSLLMLGFILTFARAYMIYRLIISPLKIIVKHFAHIAQGRYNETIEIKNQNEIGLVMSALKSMQIQLRFEIEEKKRKADENLQIKVALDSASTGVMIADNMRNIIYVNKSAVDMFDNAQADIQKQLPKFSVAHLIGTNIDDYHINPMHQVQLLSSLANTCTAEINISGRSLLINASPVINNLGQRLGTVAEWKDQTAEVRVEQEVTDIMQNILAGDFSQRIAIQDKKGFIKELTIKLNQLFDSNEESINQRIHVDNALIKLSLAVEQSSSSVIITDLKGDIEYVNETFVTITGYSRDEVIGRNPRLLKSGKTHSETYVDMWATLIKGDAWQGEVINLTKQGIEYIELVKITPVRQSNGKITHYLGLKEDITAQKQVELCLQQSEQALREAKDAAEALAKAKTQFLANMSHEIRTPMNGVIGFSELALRKEMPVEIRDYLTKINSASTSLLGILNDILDLSKLEVGGIILNPVLFELAELKDTLHNLFNDTAQQKGLDFNIELAPDLPLRLVGDDLRLQQVLINLLGNAIKFTASGSVSLSISLLANETSENRLLFCVKDTGIGLSETDQDKLFKPFSQVDDSITRRFGGTGLGLAISCNLVQLMGSHILVESALGQGSRFSFEVLLGMPTTIIEKPETTRLSPLNNVGQLPVGTRILVAEDNTFNQQVVMELLRLSGASVEVANNGEEALALLELGEFDAVLMDVHMPVMDGFEATQKIRNLAEFAQLPVIALTAGVTQEERNLCLAAGMNDFINKPINTQQLLSTLTRWINAK